MRTGEYSLTDEEPKWRTLEEPDATGFRGITSSSIVQGTCEPNNFTNDGFCIRYC